MNKYILPNRNTARLLKVDVDTEDIDVIDYSTSNINWMYIIPEDGEFKNAKTGKITKVKKYDVVIQFYTKDYTSTDAIVIHNKEWATRIKEMEKEGNKKCTDPANLCSDCESCGTCEG